MRIGDVLHKVIVSGLALTTVVLGVQVAVGSSQTFRRHYERKRMSEQEYRDSQLEPNISTDLTHNEESTQNA